MIEILLRRLLPGLGLLVHKIDQLQQEVRTMSGNLSSEIQALRDDVSQIRELRPAIVAALQGIPQRISDAVQQALQAGATQEQLAAIHELEAGLRGEIQPLADAVLANTAATSQTPPAEPAQDGGEASGATGDTSGTAPAGGDASGAPGGTAPAAGNPGSA